MSKMFEVPLEDMYKIINNEWIQKKPLIIVFNKNKKHLWIQW
jgi:hypothetical protein